MSDRMFVQNRFVRNIAIGGLTLLCTLMIGTSAVFAAEVPRGATEVKVPIAFGANEAVAGVEFAFEKSAGLKYERFEASATDAGKVGGTASNGKNWVGFYATDNRYASGVSGLDVGNLVFRYEGDAAETVTITDVKLHRVNASGGVETEKSALNAVFTVTRAKSGEGGVESPDGNGGVIPIPPGTGSKSGGQAEKANTGNVRNTGGRASGVSTGVASDQNGANGANKDEAAVSEMVPFAPFESADGAASIPDGNAPLAAPSTDGAASVTGGVLDPAWIALIALFVTAAILLLLFRRRRRKNGDDATAGF